MMVQRAARCQAALTALCRELLSSFLTFGLAILALYGGVRDCNRGADIWKRSRLEVIPCLAADIVALLASKCAAPCLVMKWKGAILFGGLLSKKGIPYMDTSERNYGVQCDQSCSSAVATAHTHEQSASPFISGYTAIYISFFCYR